MPDSRSGHIAIIGAGNLGIALAHLFSGQGFEVVLGSRTPTKTIELLAGIVTERNFEIVDYAGAVKNADINLLTVPDDFIEEVCEWLAPELKVDCIVAHCSGALDSRVLYRAAEGGCKTCSLHPLNTFPNIEAALQLLGDTQHHTALYCEGDPVTLAGITPIFEKSGFRLLEISREDKPLYHAACVFACNYLTALMDASLQTAEAAKLDRREFWQSLQPLIESTLQNISGKGTQESLSGPIARGDANTVGKHLHELAGIKTQLAVTYADLGKYALSLAVARGELTADSIAELQALLSEFDH